MATETHITDNNVILTWGEALIKSPQVLLSYCSGEVGGRVWLTADGVRWLVEHGREFLEGLEVEEATPETTPETIP